MHRRSTRITPIAAAILVALLAACGGGTGGGPNATTSPEEQRLLDGARMDLQGRCERASEDLPKATIAAIQCTVAGDRIGVRLFLFNRQEDLLAAYTQLVGAAGLSLAAQGPNGAVEGAYFPGPDSPDEPQPNRQASWIERSGHAKYLGTLPPFVLASAESLDPDAASLTTWAWSGNQDQPGAPTLWRDGSPVIPNEKG